MNKHSWPGCSLCLSSRQLKFILELWLMEIKLDLWEVSHHCFLEMLLTKYASRKNCSTCRRKCIVAFCSAQVFALCIGIYLNIVPFQEKKNKNWFYCFEFSWAVDVEWKKEKWNLGGFWSQLVCPCIGSILEISAAQVYHVSYHRLSKTVKLLEDQISMYNKCTGWQHSEFPEKIQTQRSEHRMILNSWCFIFHQNKLLSLRDNTLTLKIRPPAFGQVSW